MKVVLIGAGGHGRVLLDAARGAGLDVVAALDEDASRHGELFEDVRIVGNEDVLPKLQAQGVEGAILGVGSVGPRQTREALFTRLKATGLVLPTVTHPSAIVAPTATIAEATVVFATAVVNAGAHVGRNVIINSAAVVEHDCVIEDHVHIAPGARLAGGVRVGAASHIGIGSVVIERLTIGSKALIGAGAVVIRDVPDGARVVGVPAHEIGYNRT